VTQRKVVLALAASEDLVELIEHVVAAAGHAAAVAIDARLDAALASLATHAERGRVVPELRERGVTGFREILCAPHRIIYRVTAHEVGVVAVVDHRRDLDTLLALRARRG
jgi:plasmid stabilization system protein ParE